MTFRQLYDHMAQYVHDKDLRWRHVMRVKRGVTDPNQLGGYGHDQVYFEGTYTFLSSLQNKHVIWDKKSFETFCLFGHRVQNF